MIYTASSKTTLNQQDRPFYFSTSHKEARQHMYRIIKRQHLFSPFRLSPSQKKKTSVTYVAVRRVPHEALAFVRSRARAKAILETLAVAVKRLVSIVACLASALLEAAPVTLCVALAALNWRQGCGGGEADSQSQNNDEAHGERIRLRVPFCPSCCEIQTTLLKKSLRRNNVVAMIRGGMSSSGGRGGLVYIRIGPRHINYYIQSLTAPLGGLTDSLSIFFLGIHL